MNWIDTPLLVYSLSEGHPARERVTEALSRGQWASSILVLLEVYQVLAIDYAITRDVAAAQVGALLNSPIQWSGADVSQAATVTRYRYQFGLGGADAALLVLCTEDEGVLHTLDARLLRVAREQGLAVSTLVDRTVAERVHEWEEQHLPPRGLPRLLRSMYLWIGQQDPRVAERFIESTKNLTRLPV